MIMAGTSDTRASRLLCIDSLDLGVLVERLREQQACALKVLDATACADLLEESAALGWRPARAVVGKPGREVYQNMDICTGLPDGSLYQRLADEWQALWDRALAPLPHSPFEGRLLFNDRLLQRYAPTPVGITPHRDRIGYRNLVSLLVLGGEGRFCVCDDRAGNGVREIPADAGDVLLMRAPGFLGETIQPFHFVDRIRVQRHVFGLRQACEPPRQRY